MSEVSSLHVHPALVRTVQGVALWAVFSGLGACGAESENDDTLGRRVAQASTDSTETQIEGQSGTEYEPGGLRPACPCGWLHNPLRGTVLDVVKHIEGTDGFPIRRGTVRVRVDELLGNTSGLEIGSEIVAPWWGELPCFDGCASVAAGDEVLAFYRPAEPCVRTPGIECSLGDTIPASIALTPWGETMLLARFFNGDLTLDVEEIPLLESPECSERIGSTGDLAGPNDQGERCYEVAPRTP
jgi:hypothetical protein